MVKPVDMTGKKYNSITAIKIVGVASSGDKKWLFVCDCGIEFEANGYYARSGKVISCPKCAAERTRIASVKHGLSKTPEFSTWTDIKSRCYNKNRKEFYRYGGRGISVCKRWLDSFDNFLADMGKRPSPNHSIERLNNNGNYEPSNCKWATMSEQQRNKRNKHLIEIDGITKHLCDWAKESGLNPSTILLRERSGLVGQDLIKQSRR